MARRVIFFCYGRRAFGGKIWANSVLATNQGAALGVQLFCKNVDAEFVDLTLDIDADPQGTKWPHANAIEDAGPADILYCQAAGSLEAIRTFRRCNPRGLVVLQRDSTHARFHRDAMLAAMKRHGIRWPHGYEGPLLDYEEAEYREADVIFTLSRHVTETFRQQRLGHKTIQFGPQLLELGRWPFRPWGERDRRFGAPVGERFTALAVGQTGLRKGTLDLLDAWRPFAERNRNVKLLIAGLPEMGAPPELAARLDQAMARCPSGSVESLGWVPMDGMGEWYARSHVWISCSVEEGSTMPGLEAAASGCALMATPESGVDILQHGRTGFMLPPAHHPDRLAGMQAWLQHAHDSLLDPQHEASSDLPAMGRAAREAAERCDYPHYVANVATALDRAWRLHAAGY